MKVYRSSNALDNSLKFPTSYFLPNLRKEITAVQSHKTYGGNGRFFPLKRFDQWPSSHDVNYLLHVIALP